MAVKLIIFDFSGVCFTEEEPVYLRHFADKHKLPWEEFEAFYMDLIKKAEVDAISGKEVWEQVKRRFRLSIDVDGTIKEMIDWKEAHYDVLGIAKKLRSHYQITYFTNYNRVYWAYITAKFKIENYFDFGIVSYQIKSRKPAIEGFKFLLQHFNVKPEEAVFMDDSAKNLVEPGKLGIHTFQFLNKEQMLQELKKIGVVISSQ